MIIEMSYEKDMERSGILCTVAEECVRNEYELRMLENKIEGLLPISEVKKDGESKYYYECTGYQALSSYVTSKKLDITFLSKLLSEVIHTVKLAKTFLLSENNFLVAIENIYIREQDMEFALMYYPGYKTDIREQFVKLLEQCMKLVDYNDKSSVQFVYYMYSKVHEAECTFESLLEAIHDEKRYGTLSYQVKKRFEEDVEEKKELADTNQKIELPVMADELNQEEEQYYYPIACYIKFGVSVILTILMFYFFFHYDLYKNSSGEKSTLKFLCGIVMIFSIELYMTTRIFDQSNRCTKMCTNTSYITYQDVLLKKDNLLKKSFGSQVNFKKQMSRTSYDMSEHKNKEVYLSETATECLSLDALNKRESKEQEGATVLLTKGGATLLLRSKTSKDITVKEDCVLGSSERYADYLIENHTVSRRHAKIVKKEEMYYITDLNSTNGTYVNECIVRATQCIPLHSGDKIMLADEEFEVEIFSGVNDEVG